LARTGGKTKNSFENERQTSNKVLKKGKGKGKRKKRRGEAYSLLVRYSLPRGKLLFAKKRERERQENENRPAGGGLKRGGGTPTRADSKKELAKNYWTRRKPREAACHKNWKERKGRPDALAKRVGRGHYEKDLAKRPATRAVTGWGNEETGAENGLGQGVG